MEIPRKVIQNFRLISASKQERRIVYLMESCVSKKNTFLPCYQVEVKLKLKLKVNVISSVGNCVIICVIYCKFNRRKSSIL